MKNYDLLVSKKPNDKDNIFDALDVDFEDVASLPVSILELSPTIKKVFGSKSKIVDGVARPYFETLGDLIGVEYETLFDILQEKLLINSAMDCIQEIEEKLAEFALKLRNTRFTVFDIELSSLNLSADAKNWAERKGHETLADIYMLGSAKLNKMINSPKGKARQAVGKEMVELLQSYGIQAEKVRLSNQAESEDGILKTKGKLKHSFPKILWYVKTKTQKIEEEKEKKEAEKNNPEAQTEPVLENEIIKTMPQKDEVSKEQPKPEEKQEKTAKVLTAPDPNEIRMSAFQTNVQVPEWLKKQQAEEEAKKLREEIAKKQAEAEEERVRAIVREMQAEKERKKKEKKEAERKQHYLDDQEIAKQRGITVEELRAERIKIAQSRDNLLKVKPLFFSAGVPEQSAPTRSKNEDDIAVKKILRDIAASSSGKKEETAPVTTEQKQRTAEMVKAGYAKLKAANAQKEREERRAKKAQELAAKKAKAAERQAKKESASLSQKQLEAEAANLGISLSELKEQKRVQAIKDAWARRRAANPEAAEKALKLKQEKEAAHARRVEKQKQLEAEAAEKGITVEELKEIKKREYFREVERKRRLKRNILSEEKRAKREEERAAKKKQLEEEAKKKKEARETRLAEKQAEQEKKLAAKKEREERKEAKLKEKTEKQKQLEVEAASRGITVEELKKIKRAEITANANKKRWADFYANNPDKTEEGKRALKRKKLEEEAAAAGMTVEELKLKKKQEEAAAAREKRIANASARREVKQRELEAEAKSRGITLEQLADEKRKQQYKEANKRRMAKYYAAHPEALERKQEKEKIEKQREEGRKKREEQKLMAQKQMEADIAAANEQGVSLEEYRKTRAKQNRAMAIAKANEIKKAEKEKKLKEEAAAKGISVEELKEKIRKEKLRISSKRHYDKVHGISPEKRQRLNEMAGSGDGRHARKIERDKKLAEEAANLGISVEELKERIKKEQIRASSLKYYDKVHNVTPEERAKREKIKQERLKKKEEAQKQIEADIAAATAKGISLEEYKKQKAKESRILTAEIARKKRLENRARKTEEEAKQRENLVLISEAQADTLLNMKSYEFKALSTKVFNIFGISKRMAVAIEDMATTNDIITVNDFARFNFNNIKNYRNNGHVTNYKDIQTIEDILAYYSIMISGTKYMIRNRKVARDARFKGEALDVEAELNKLKLDAKNKPDAKIKYPDILVPPTVAREDDSLKIGGFGFQYANTSYGGGAIRVKPVHSERLTNTVADEKTSNANVSPKVISDSDIASATKRLSWFKDRLAQKGAAAAIDVAGTFFKESSAEFKVISKMLEEYLMQMTYSAIMSGGESKDINEITLKVTSEKQLFERIVEAKRNGTPMSEFKIESDNGGGSGSGSTGGTNKKFHHSENGWARKGVRVHKFGSGSKVTELDDGLDLNGFELD